MDTVKTSVIAALPELVAPQAVAARGANISTHGKRSGRIRARSTPGAASPVVTSHLDSPPAVSQAEIELVLSFLHDTIAAIMRDN